MELTTVTVSSKGQIAIPKTLRESARIQGGTVLLVSQHGGRILLEPVGNFSEELQEHIRTLSHSTEQTLRKVWDNEKDDAWSKDLARRHSADKIPVHRLNGVKNQTRHRGSRSK